MISVFYMLLPLIIVSVISLVIPIIIVIKWKSRPFLSLVTASVVYLLPMLLFIIGSILYGYQRATGAELYLYMFIFLTVYLFFGLIFLVPIQRVSRKRQRQNLTDKIEMTF